MTEIRPITEADFDAVAVVHVRSWQVAYAGIVPADYLAALDPAALAERRRQQVATAPPGAGILVAVDGDQVIGFAAFGPHREEPSHGELFAIYVDPSHWDTGAGRLLITAAKEQLTAYGFPDMRLWVLEENHRARRFYERAGMTADGTRDMFRPLGSDVELPELRYVVDL